MTAPLIREVYAAVHEHAARKRETDNQTLTRIAGKLLTRLDHPRRAEILASIRAEKVHVVKETWPLSRVLELFAGSTVLAEGRDDIPLVAIRLDGEIRQIDGGKRVRRWRERGRDGDPSVLIVTPIE